MPINDASPKELTVRTHPTSKLLSAKAIIGYVFADWVPRMRIMVVIGLLLTIHFVWWFADADHIGYAPLFWLLSISLGFKLLRMLHEWYHYVQVSVPVSPPTATSVTNSTPAYTVDVLTTFCPGEPYQMIVDTLRAMQGITYPHTSYLCDEGNDPYLRRVCAELGVVHVTRTEKVNAKAGNINNALRQATGELCVVLDPDHAPTPDFLDKVVAYFADPAVGYVQVVQAYGNQHESLVARGAAEQTYHFYGPLMMGMNSYNTAQAIGANCTFRRAALDSIGGHAAGLTEDMHTAMRLHAQGWKSVYVPVIVSRGLVPASLAAYYAQQLKWARGSFELLFWVYPKLFKHFTWRQRLHYATLPLYFLSGVVTLIDIGVPIASLVLAEFPWHLSLPTFALHLTPVLMISLLIRYNAQRWLRETHENGLHLAGGFLRIGTWWVYCLGFVYTLLRIRVPYIPTPKEGRGGNEWQLSLPNIVVAIISLAAVRYGHILNQTPYALFMMVLATSNAAIIGVSVLMAQHNLLAGVERMATSFRPTRWLVHTTEQSISKLGYILLGWIRTSAVPVAFTLLIAHSFISVGVVVWLRQSSLSPELIWARSGSGDVRVGYAAQTSADQAAFTYSATSTTAGTTPGVVELRLRPALGPRITPAALEKLDAQGSIPLLSWEVTGNSFDDAAWQRGVSAIRQRNQAVMLRPLIATRNAAAYRATWQRLVQHFRASGDTSAVWVWTPPHPDSVAAYFPGAAYTDWVAADLTATSTTTEASYQPLRLQLAERAELNSKPVIIFTLPQSNAKLHVQTEQFTRLYPEVKALIFSPYATQKKPIILSSQTTFLPNAPY